MEAREGTPLLSKQQWPKNDESLLCKDPDEKESLLWGDEQPPITWRTQVYLFLEAKTPAGLTYEIFTFSLILMNVASFVLGTLFDPEYNTAKYASTACGRLCDALWFGNYEDNLLAFLHLGPTSVLELFTVFVFTVDYVLRIWIADLEDTRFSGALGRLRYVPTFYSIVDLASIVPFYVDVALVNTNLASSQFMRMFRILRMMKVEGRYETALTMFDDVFYQQRGILGTALFVGTTTWAAVSSLYYLAERRNTDMIYCGSASEICMTDVDDIDTSLCSIDSWGFVDCTAAGCPPTVDAPEPCYNMYRSILSASYYSLLNLFGEFPLIDQHSPFGKLVGTVVAVVAVAVFALPAGIIGNGFEDVLEQRREARGADEVGLPEQSEELETTEQEEEFEFKSPQLFYASDETLIGRAYNFFHVSSTPAATAYRHVVDVLVVGTSLTFICGTTQFFVGKSSVMKAFERFEVLAVLVFTFDYVIKLYCISENPYYAGRYGRWLFARSFLPIVDLLSFGPYWIALLFAVQRTNTVKCMRLLRIFRFERYTKAFTTFDDVIHVNYDLLVVTGVAALILWIFFSAIMYLAERGNPDAGTAMYYSTVPQAMWVTLLNLSGEAPLCNYTLLGKITTGVIGLFASGLFGIPIGIMGSGFEEIISEKLTDSPDEVPASPRGPGFRKTLQSLFSGSDSTETRVFRFVNGEGSLYAAHFESLIYTLIIMTVCIGVLQTVQGQENTLHELEWIAVLVFTIEYMLRFYGAPADPEFTRNRRIDSPWKIRLRFLFSFYSVIDLLAILPMYLAYLMPGSWVDKHDEYLRMLRLVRLLKLDKYVPSITLIDDVLRLKRSSLIVTGYAAGTLWIVFSGLLYLFEYNDAVNAIDDVPVYGCDSDCTMSDRFKNYLDSMVYTCIHLTGDYPIITYTAAARVACFFMVIAAVGVVSVFSALIATGFTDIVQSKSKAKRAVGGDLSRDDGEEGGDWYEYQLSLLKKLQQDPPPSRFGPAVDEWQIQVNEFLNGTEDQITGSTYRTPLSSNARVFMLLIIVANVAAVVLESVPEIDRAVGNEPGNAFDVFEEFSVFVFATEYALRLFSARKNRDALYSPLVYATTFFGIVDFLSTAPWFIEETLIKLGKISNGSDMATVFRLFRIFRILQAEDFIVAFSKLDNVFRASRDVLKATGLMAVIIWVGCGALFFIFEQDNPNWRECDDSIPLRGSGSELGCYDFETVADCNRFYGDGTCRQTAFVNMPDSLYYTAVFLGGEWGLVDFTFYGRFVCVFLCVAGIALYAIPVGTLFDSFGAIIGLSEEG